MPSVGEIDSAVGSYIPADRVAAIRTLIRAAVEQAVAPWMQAVGLATTFAGSVEVNPDDPLGMMEEIRQALAEREAQHKRELIETRIDAIENFDGWTSFEWVKEMRAKLAAPEVNP